MGFSSKNIFLALFLILCTSCAKQNSYQSNNQDEILNDWVVAVTQLDRESTTDLLSKYPGLINEIGDFKIQDRYIRGTALDYTSHMYLSYVESHTSKTHNTKEHKKQSRDNFVDDYFQTPGLINQINSFTNFLISNGARRSPAFNRNYHVKLSELFDRD